MIEKFATRPGFLPGWLGTCGAVHARLDERLGSLAVESFGDRDACGYPFGLS